MALQQHQAQTFPFLLFLPLSILYNTAAQAKERANCVGRRNTFMFQNCLFCNIWYFDAFRFIVQLN
jgi:hypothetical protein